MLSHVFWGDGRFCFLRAPSAPVRFPKTVAHDGQSVHRLAVLITAGAALVSQASQEALRSDHAAGRSPRNAFIAVSCSIMACIRVHRLQSLGTAVRHIGHISPDCMLWPKSLPTSGRIRLILLSISGRRDRNNSTFIKILARTGAEAVIADPQACCCGGEPPLFQRPGRKSKEPTHMSISFT